MRTRDSREEGKVSVGTGAAWRRDSVTRHARGWRGWRERERPKNRKQLFIRNKRRAVAAEHFFFVGRGVEEVTWSPNTHMQLLAEMSGIVDAPSPIVVGFSVHGFILPTLHKRTRLGVTNGCVALEDGVVSHSTADETEK